MPRYAKKGSTKLDIMNKMFNIMKADPECKWVHIGNISDFNQIPNFASINPALYNDFIGSFIYSELAYTDKNKASKDLKKVNFDFENHDVTTDDDFARSHSSLPDGTEFIWCWAGGDWEWDVNFILYLDPNDTIRAYIPSNGNLYCHKCKCAWGTCECGATEPDEDLDKHDFAMMYADVCNRILTM